jgi:hypothetical protein
LPFQETIYRSRVIRALCLAEKLELLLSFLYQLNRFILGRFCRQLLAGLDQYWSSKKVSIATAYGPSRPYGRSLIRRIGEKAWRPDDPGRFSQVKKRLRPFLVVP